MAIDLDYFASDLAGMIADLPALCRYAGKTFNVSVSEWDRSETLSLTGNLEGIDFQITLASADISGLPELKTDSRIEIQRTSEAQFSRYMVKSVAKAHDNVSYIASVMADRRN